MPNKHGLYKHRLDKHGLEHGLMHNMPNKHTLYKHNTKHKPGLEHGLRHIDSALSVIARKQPMTLYIYHLTQYDRFVGTGLLPSIAYIDHLTRYVRFVGSGLLPSIALLVQ